MNPPQVYMCSPSWTLLLPPSPFHPSGSSQCTSPKHPVSCIKPGLATRFIHDILHVSTPFSQISPPSPSPTESIRLIYTSVSTSCADSCKDSLPGKGREANVSSSLWSSVSHLSTILSILDELLLTEMSKADYLLIDHCTISEADENISSSFIFKKRKIENHAYEGNIRKQQAKEKESIIIISPLLKVVRGYYC